MTSANREEVAVQQVQSEGNNNNNKNNNNNNHNNNINNNNSPQQESGASASNASQGQGQAPASPSPEVSLRSRSRSGPRSLTPFSNLSQLPLKAFVSPFIDPDAVMQKPAKKIVTWHRPDRPQALRGGGVFDDCPISACKLIHPLPPTAVADAVIFDRIDTKHPPPPRVHSDQAFVLHQMSPPPLPQQQIWPPAWNGAFNWTWSYRRDADIWQPLGLLKKSNKVRSADFFLELAKGKTKPAVFLPRSCAQETASRREGYLEELKRHLKVAELGPCFNRSCGKEGMSCSQVLTNKFFFLLALEDDLCRDHVTEVFYRAWQEDTYIVPVVRGGTDYAAYFPEGTFVDADWFEGPRQLAGFLTELMESRRLYSQLLWRRSHWVRAVRSPEELSLCHLCYKLHHLDASRKRYRDIRRWLDKTSCGSPRPFH